MKWVHRHIRQISKFWDKYERVLSGGSLLIGFIVDLFLAKRPDSPLDNILLLFYLFLAATLIILLNIRARKLGDESVTLPMVRLLMLQFCFGGLASNLLVLYGKSGTLAGSTLFILLLSGMVVGNEFLKTRYAHLRFNIVVYYILLLTYLVIAMPTFVFHRVNVWVFLASDLASLVFMSLFLYVVHKLIFRGEKKNQTAEVSVLVGLAFFVFNALYFLNIIPPVPLSLKAIGIYHEVSHTTSGGYRVSYEQPQWYAFWRDTSDIYTYQAGDMAYCFSAVFAPSDLETPIFHRWEHFNDATGNWDTLSRVSFPISGGRDEGYRTFSVKANLLAGQWRCDVETQTGALIGRISFTALQSSTTLQLSTKNL